MRAHIIENGIVINTIEVDDLNFPVNPGQSLVGGEVGGIGWTFKNGQLHQPDMESSDLEDTEQKIFGSRDYLKRFTLAEYAAARRSENIEVQWALDNVIAAQYIDIEDPETVAGLDLMVSQGVISSTKRDELLTPISAI